MGVLRDILLSDDDWARQRRLMLLLSVLVLGGGVIAEVMVWTLTSLGVSRWQW